MKGFATRAIHGDSIKKDIHGALRTPVYDNVAFEHESAHDIKLAFEGRKPAHSYSRITNPTVEDFEQRLRLLSGGKVVLATASGMAAITNVILSVAEAGTNIVTTKHIFGNTISLFENTLKPWGLEARYVSMLDPIEVEQAIDTQTRAIFLENITNPQLEVANIKELSRIAVKKGVPLIVDCTMTTPYLFRSKDFGVDVEIISSTKYISGGATSVGGVIIDNGSFDWLKSPKLEEKAKKVGSLALMATLKLEVYRNTGACLSPHNAYLQSLGLETLALRIEKSCKNALNIAKHLEQLDGICGVNYPGLETSPFFYIAQAQFNQLFGGLLTFELESEAACFSFMDALKLIKRATNINDNKTLIIHPSSTIFHEFTLEEKQRMQISPNMLRLSVGIEDLNDLIEDLENGRKAP